MDETTNSEIVDPAAIDLDHNASVTVDLSTVLDGQDTEA